MPGTKARAKPVVSHTLYEFDASRVLEIRGETSRTARSDFYLLDLRRSDFGRAFRLLKLGPDRTVYDVCLEADGTQHCSCVGFEARGACKHARTLAVLVSEGQL